MRARAVRRRSLALLAVISMVMALTPAGVGGAATGDPVLLNEVLASHSGTDDTEYIELFGTPGTSLSGLSVIVVEGDAFGPGTIDRRFDFKSFHQLGTNGFFLIGNCGGLLANYAVTPDASLSTDYIENSSLTIALVETSSLGGDNVTGSEVVRDAVALDDGDAGDTFYFGAPAIGPDGPFFPAGARRVADGVDTDAAADWVISSFNLPGDNTPVGGGRDGCAPIALTIPEIQGDGQFSPYEGEVVITSGVVTAVSANGRDMWIQDPVGDGDPATSDGIFVDDRDFLTPAPEVGDYVQVQAAVEEQQFGTALPLTRLNNPDADEFQILSSGNPLPAPVPLDDLPNEIISDGIFYWEPIEGMLAAVSDARVIAATNGFGEFGMLAEADAEPGSGYYPQVSQIIVRDLGGEMVDYNPERIMVDDTTVEDAIQVRPGDMVYSLVGVVDYTFSNYKLQPLSWDIERDGLPRRATFSTRSGPKGDTVITTFNVENLFDLVVNEPTVVDVIGQVGFDPGSEWSGGGIGTQDETLRRKASICEGDPDGTDAFDPSVEWDGFALNNIDDLGSHTVTCGTASGLFISEYVEGSSLNKAIEIYNGTGAAVNLASINATLQVFFNGNTSAGTTIQLSGTLADGDVFVVADDGASSAILAVADQTTTASLFNGDDAIVLTVGGKDDASSTPEPEELETQLAKLALAIERELQLPDIIVVQEIENEEIGQELADLVNDATGTDYVATSFETSDGRGIEVGFLWDADRVDLREAYQLSGPDVEAWFGPSSPSPGREPLYGLFQIGDHEVHIVGNHFKSKGGDDPLYGVSWLEDPPALPVRVTEIQRKGQAEVVRDFVDFILDDDPDALVMVTGDLNDFQFSEPGEGADHPVAIVAGYEGGVPLTNLIELEKAAERWTFVFDGNSQVLDHMLVSPALLDALAGTDILHFNTTINAAFEDDATSALAASDHEPVEGRFRLK